ncbi:hypothetical protein MXAN_4168 [Myxococcus xanthus DK 1622]|uniref:Uncharacterized protein n=2 Tax=Myxococcus xanthus TaxID=34 RepID=Q1D4T0_MYXXD|nr:hypothetical protein MXAN_4168 [Myxococcus xanthus DK 1622]NOJ53962.1 hypothetical protein [Myxococcus xanthus]QVW65838.1 hypothetical protein JTM82_25975 [Myxococcus xanthus DZ2]QPM76771.1 hypothetical protein I5Q59_20620 [Myxococcus xanthus]QZZ51855.1 hypothetical protein MyxoNM_21855 [Myxococcus xanthus]
MSVPGIGFPGPWRLRSGAEEYELLVMRAVTALDERERVPAEHITWQLDHWLTSARRPLLEMYEALGGILPWNASSLDRARQDARVRDRLVQALERRELVALRVQRRAAAWAWPEPALPPPRPEPEVIPLARPPVEVFTLFPDPARQAEALRQAAAAGVPFCEECEKQKQRAAA